MVDKIWPNTVLRFRVTLPQLLSTFAVDAPTGTLYCTVLYTFICHVVDYKFGGFFCIIFVRLLNILNVPTGTHFARFFYTI
jgi:hypothetical protein